MSDAFTDLADLKVHLEQSTAGGVLALTPQTCPVVPVGDFLADLPDQQIRLSTPDIQLTDGRLTVAGTAAEQWPVGDSGERMFRLDSVRVVVTQPAGLVAALQVNGAVTVGGADVAVTGQLAKAGRINATLAATPGLTLPLAALADFATGEGLADTLPVGTAIFDQVPLSSLDLAFGYAPTAADIAVGATVEGATWPLINGLLDLTGVGVTLFGRTGFESGRYIHTAGGVISAALRLDGRDFQVRLVLRGQDAWELEILPADGNLLPGLDALARLAGGPDLAGEVRAGLDRLGLGAITIDAVRIGFDMPSRRLTRLAVDTHVTIDGLTVALFLILPRFRVYGGLAPGSAVHLKALVAYFPGAEAFPEVDITELWVSAEPGAGRYEFTARIVTDWDLTVGPLAAGFRALALTIVKTPDGVTGGVEGYFSLFGADFYAAAEHPQAGGGWQFTCRSRPGQQLTIAAIHAQIVAAFGVDATLPRAIEHLTVDRLEIWFDTGSGAFQFACEARFPVDDKDVDITVTIRLERVGEAYRKTFGGHVVVVDLDFDLHLVQDQPSTVLVATYYHTGDPRPLRVADLVRAVSTPLAGVVPESLSIDLRDVVFAVSQGERTGFVFGLDLGTRIGLSDLPLVGKEFPPDRSVGVDSLRLLVVSQDFSAAETAALNALLPAQVPALPAVAGQDAAALARGVTVAARLSLGEAAPQSLVLPVAGADPTVGTPIAPGPGDPAAPPPVLASDDTRWFDVQRAFGPVYFQRVGFQYRDGEVRFLLDAELTVAGLTLTLDGLTFGSPIDSFAPTFDLRGLGLDYRSGPVEIGGALLRTTVTPPGAPSYDEYDGAALIRTAKLALAALGGYVYVNGQPSLFVYAVLDRALGGPPFFTVTGLAAGFGYNRALVVPPIEQVADFPLIKAATSPQPITGNASPRELLRSAQDQLRSWIPPVAGSVFLAVGVRFSSFQMIDSFALLVASFGDRFELNLLGLSTLVAPTPDPADPVSPLAELQLAVRASFVPDDGSLKVSAQLTAASYLFSRDCHLTGGFAFSSWFRGEHAGDFALTVGGYHPQFRVPAHYPQVPRLGFNWQVDPQLGIKGDGYYALTPVALMAGGHLEVVWQSGSLRAVFTSGIDFIVAWKPYHYDARAYVDFNVSYTFQLFGTHHVTVDIGADLHIWGPEFAGTAHINLSIISFDVTFGDQSQRGPAALDWSSFRRSFLPDSGLCALAVGDGLIHKSSDDPTDLGVVDPHRLVVMASTVVPSTAARIRGDLVLNPVYFTGAAADAAPVPYVAADDRAVPAQTPTGWHRPVGQLAVGPMAVRLPGHGGPHLVSTVTVAVTRGIEPMEHHFGFVPVLTSVPAGMWGELGADLRPDPNAEPLARDVLTGFEIRPRLAPIEGTDRAIAGGTELLQYHLPALPGGRYGVTVSQEVTTDEAGDAAIRTIPPQRFIGTGEFLVGGARAAIPPDDVYAVYPPDGAVGEYSADLPHVILNSSTLPWQETADPDRDDLPWLAVLLFGEEDMPTPHVVTVGQLRNPATLPTELRGPAFPADTLDDGQPDSDKVTVLDLPAALLRQYLPAQDAQRRDLALLAHVRRAPDGAERAVLIGNRLPRRGAAHVAHLVSVRDRYGASGFDTAGVDDAALVRLISVASWRFVSTGTDTDLAGLLRRIAGRAGPLRLPAGTGPNSDESRLAAGYLPVDYVDPQGTRSPAWYRGPLAPQPVSDRPALPVHEPDELTTDPANLAFATGWQLGRLLAIQSKPFATALYRWKRARAQRRKTGDPTLPPVPVAVADWLGDLALLRGVPFNHLVPDERTVPVESLRFFSLDTGWVACLLDGALSIGRVTPSDFDADRTLGKDLCDAAASALSPWTKQVLRPDADQPDGGGAAARVSGFLLRSHAVDGWPDLQITAAGAGGNALQPVRREELSSNVLLCLFDGEIASVTITQAEHTLHFGLGDDATGWQQGLRVVDVTEVARKRIGADAATAAASARFAAQMLAPPPQVDIARSS